MPFAGFRIGCLTAQHSTVLSRVMSASAIGITELQVMLRFPVDAMLTLSLGYQFHLCAGPSFVLISAQ